MVILIEEETEPGVEGVTGVLGEPTEVPSNGATGLLGESARDGVRGQIRGVFGVLGTLGTVYLVRVFGTRRVRGVPGDLGEIEYSLLEGDLVVTIVFWDLGVDGVEPAFLALSKDSRIIPATVSASNLPIGGHGEADGTGGEEFSSFSLVAIVVATSCDK